MVCATRNPATPVELIIIQCSMLLLQTNRGDALTRELLRHDGQTRSPQPYVPWKRPCCASA